MRLFDASMIAAATALFAIPASAQIGPPGPPGMAHRAAIRHHVMRREIARERHDAYHHNRYDDDRHHGCRDYSVTHHSDGSVSRRCRH